MEATATYTLFVLQVEINAESEKGMKGGVEEFFPPKTLILTYQ